MTKSSQKNARTVEKNKNQSERNIAKTRSPWARLIHHIQWHHQILTKQCAHCGKQPESQSERNIVKTRSPWARLIHHIQWHHQIFTKKCAHCGKQPESQSERNIVNTRSPWARLICHIQWHHQILTKQCAHCGNQLESQSERNIMKAKSPWARLIQHIQWHHQILTKPCTHCAEHKRTQSNSCATNRKSHCARSIQHTSHWHHQILTKPCAHCVKQNSIHLSWHQQQITLCTAQSAQNGKYKRIGSQNESWTRWERDANEIQGLHLATPVLAQKGMQQRLLSIYLSNPIYLSIYLSLALYLSLSVCLSLCLSLSLSVSLSLCLSLSLSLSVSLSVCLSGWLAVCLSICFAASLTFRAPASAFFYLFSRPLFYSSLLCFSSFQILRSLTPKLPLKKKIYIYIYPFHSLPHSDWWRPEAMWPSLQHLQPSPNTAGTQTLSTSPHIQKYQKSSRTWGNPAGTQDATRFGRVPRVRASTQ